MNDEGESERVKNRSASIFRT